MQFLERRVLATRLAGQRFAVKRGDALAQLLLQVGVDQHAVAQAETGVAIQRIDPGLFAVALGAHVGVEIEQAAHWCLLTAGLEQLLQRDALDLLAGGQQRDGWAGVELRAHGELAAVQVAAQFLEVDQAALGGQGKARILDRQLAEGQLAEADGGLDVEFAQGFQRQQRRAAPGLLGRRAGQRGGAAVAGGGHGLLDLVLARRAGVGVLVLRRQVAVEVELVALELQAQGLLGDIAERQVAAEGAVVQLQAEVVEVDAGRRARQAGGHLEAAEGGVVAHGWQDDADAVEELAQVELRQRQVALQLGGLVQVAQLQLAEGAQLVGGELDAGPLGHLGRLVEQQLALAGEGQGLAAQGLTRGFARQLEVLQLVALEGAVEAQQALQLGLGAQYRLVAAEEGQQFDRDIGALADGACGQLDALGAELLAALGVLVVHARVADG